MTERDEQLDRIEGILKQIQKDLHGDPSDRQAGLIVRVDRLEQDHRRWKSRGVPFLCALGSALGAGAVTLVTILVG